MKKLKLLTFLVVWVATVSSAIGQVPYFEWAKEISCDTCQTGNNSFISSLNIHHKDNLGNIYIAGYVSDIENNPWEGGNYVHEDVGVYIAKYNVQGNKLWEKMFHNGISFTGPKQLITDQQGNVYLSGYFTESLGIGAFGLGNDTVLAINNTFITKLSSSGQVLWAKAGSALGASAEEQVGIVDTQYDNEGNVYILGSFTGDAVYFDNFLLSTPYNTSNSFQKFLIKYNSQGQLQWGHQIDFHDDNNTLVKLQIDANNNIWIAGSFNDMLRVAGDSLVSAGGRDIALLKYAPDGTFLLKKQIGGNGNDDIQKLEKSGNEIKVYGKVAGTTDILGNNFAGGSFIAKINNMGMATDVTINYNPNFIAKDLEGNYYRLLPNYSSMLVKTDSLGNEIWRKKVNGDVWKFGVNAPDDLSLIIENYENNSFDGLPVENGKLYFTKLTIGNEVNGVLSRVASASGCADTSGQKLANWVVKSAEGNYALTDANGRYRMGVPKQAGTYHVQPTIPVGLQNMAAQVCPTGAQEASFVASNTPLVVSGKNFGFQIANCHKLSVDISAGLFRPCTRTQTMVWYRNLGISVAPNAYVLVKFPAYLVPLQCALPWSLVDATTHTYRFELGNVAAGTNQSFTIKDTVLCNAPMGHTLCATASIYPVSDCPLPSNWNGSAVSVKGLCVGNGVVRLGIYNQTVNDMSDSVSYNVYYDSLLIAHKKVKLAASDSLNFQVQANGHTIRLEANQVANHPTEQQVSVVIEGCAASGGTVTTGFVDAFSVNNSISSATSCSQVRNSYDPNDKQVFPRGLTANNIVAPNTELEYVIRFQNTGNDTAYVVTVVDTLSGKLDIESLRLGAMSHKGKVELQTLQGKTYLRWTFANIMLPDSGANQLGSNGFVQFYIKPLASNVLGTQVRNKASIYFDYNAPVVTNETLTTFDNIVYSNPSLGGNVITGSQSNVVKALWTLWPIPSHGDFNINLQEAGHVTVTDVTGKSYYSQKLGSGVHTIRLSDYAAGLYFVKVADSKGVSTKKMILE